MSKSYIVRERSDGTRYFDENTPTGQISPDTIGAGLKIDDDGKVEVDDAAVVKLDGAQTLTGAKTFTVSPQVPTATSGDNSTKVANTAFVTGAIATAGADYVKKSGDTMTGAITRNGNLANSGVTNGVISIFNGTTTDGGGSIWMYGKDHANTGRTRIQAYTADAGYSRLDVNGNGTCTWSKDILATDNSKQVATTAWVKSILPSSNGFTLKPNGTIEVDFSQLDDEALNTIRKELSVAIPLTKATNFYVDIATGSDTLDEGRGLTAAKPFKTVSACVTYVANTYNMRTYNATINVAPGVYNTTTGAYGLNLGSYTTTTGRIIIKSSDASNKARIKLIRAGTTIGFAVYAQYGYYVFEDVIIEHEYTGITPRPSGTQLIVAACAANGGTLDFKNCEFVISRTGSNTSNLAYVCFRPDSGGSIIFRYDNSINVTDTGSTVPITCFEVLGGSSITFNAESGIVTTTRLLMPQVSVVASVNNSSMRMVVSAGGTTSMTAPSGFTGKRYDIVSGGNIDVGNATYFPGTIEGTVEAATYSWYK